MSKLLFCLGLSLMSVTAYGQTLSENFEGSSGIPDGWTVKNNTATDYTWKTSQYSTDVILQGISGFTSGGNNAIMANSGRNNKGVPDSWLISPKISVAEGDVLNFMMGYNCAYNGTATVADENKTKFEVLISESGTEATDFAVIYSITPEGLKNWSNYSIELSKYSGKQVYVAFREYGETGAFPFMSNNLYLDNIAVNKVKASDLSVESVSSPVSGCETEQTVKLTVANHGFDVSSFSVSYQIDDEPAVTEQANLTVANGAVVEYEFAKKAVLQQGATHSVKVWVTSDADLNHDNDAVTVEAVIGDEMSYPFAMTDDNAQTAFRSTNSRQMGNLVYGWSYYNDETAKGWGYTYYRNFTSYLLSNCILLPKGQVKVLFDYKTLIEADLNVYLVSESGNYDKVVGKVALPLSEDYSSADMTLDIPEAGVYSLAFAPSNYQGQLFLNNIQIKDPYDDIITVSIDSPELNAMLAKSGVAVKASFKNNGAKEQKNVPVSFSVDGKNTVTESIASIAAGETVEHTFAGTADLSAAGSHDIKVWSSLTTDGNTANDSKSTTVASYNAYSFPFKASFESGENTADWIRHNPDNDYIYWTIEQVVNGNVNYAKDGTYAAYINSASGTKHNDYLISPAINAKAGNARISFYYTTRMQSASATDGCNLKVSLSKTDNPADIDVSKSLTVATLTNDNVLKYTQGYVNVQVPEDGQYYLVFYNDGYGHDVILDDIRFDQAEDLCITSVENSAVSGFGLTNNTVSIKFENHGTTARSNIPVSYAVNGGTPVSETYTGSVAPGATAEYTFAKKADFSASGKYVVTASVNDPDDTDSYNNSWTSSEIKHYETEKLPYSVDFESADDREVWVPGRGWTLGTNMLNGNLAAYNGTCGVSHSGSAIDDNGDYVYSGGIYIPAGTYDFSFFYRTYMNQTDASKYGQSFEVFLSKAPESGADAISVYKVENDIVSTKQYKKVIAPVTVAESGTYYIGMKCTTTAPMGGLYMDMFSIAAPVSEGATLGSYQSDFAAKENEWYHYNPNSSAFNQWTAVTENGETYMQTTQTVVNYMNPSKEYPGAYVAPVFNLKKGDKISAELSYGIAIDNPANLSDEEKANTQIGLYLAEVNLPSAFTTAVVVGSDLSGESQKATGEITVENDGLYYLGVVADGPKRSTTGTVKVTYNFYGLKLQGENGGVSAIGNDGSELYRYAGNVLTIVGEYENAQVYTTGGVLVGNYSEVENIDLNGYAKGVYILKIATADKVVTDKLYVK